MLSLHQLDQASSPLFPHSSFHTLVCRSSSLADVDIQRGHYKLTQKKSHLDVLIDVLRNPDIYLCRPPSRYPKIRLPKVEGRLASRGGGDKLE